MTGSTTSTATVAQLWRFPVKSMGGGTVERVRIGRRGLHADRLWAVRDLDAGITATARRLPALLTCTARYETEPGADAGPGTVPPVVVTLPDGSERRSDDPALNAALSELTGRRVELTPLAAARGQHRLGVRQMIDSLSPAGIRRDLGLADDDPLPDAAGFTVREMVNLMRYSTPPQTFVDLAPVHVLTTASLAWLEERNGSPLDVRRFRPNVLLDTDEAGLPETGWLGAHLATDGVRLRVNTPTIRCVVPSRPQPGLELDRSVGRTLSRHTDRYLGSYASVVTDGEVRTGDEVRVVRPARPGPVRRVAATTLATGKRAVMRVGQSTVLR